MIKIVRTDSKNIHFVKLIEQLDAYLKITDGEDHTFYNQFNSIETIKHVVIVYVNNTPISCGAFKSYDKNTVEIKRMYTQTDYRGKGFASKVIQELEQWSKQLSYKACILETGKRQVEAIAFYKQMGYSAIANYGQYKNAENSICYKKLLV